MKDHQPLDSEVLSSLLRGSMSQWKQKWMLIEDYAAQPFVKKHKLFHDVAQICLVKLDQDYAGFTSQATTTSSGHTSYLYFNNRDKGNL
uniref:nudix hydrolase 6-like n=1 Tax=Fragaria vesca subsp. vesca TaxID=101020 RepID=UPI0005C8E832|nr:PREDICTED: nudix hydrolase 6-like [Fragaria vesca subsp. vesca]